jgi:hypothetical protein
VTRFEVDDAHAGPTSDASSARASTRSSGVPADELPAFNARLQGPIEAVSAFFGAGFVGDPLERDPRHCLHALVAAWRRRDADVIRALAAARLATFLYYPYWRACPAPELDVDEESLGDVFESVRSCWPKVGGAGLIERGEQVPCDRTPG